MLKENYFLFHHYTFVVQIKKIADLSSNRTKPFERQIRIIKGMSMVLLYLYVTFCKWQNIFQSKMLSWIWNFQSKMLSWIWKLFTCPFHFVTVFHKAAYTKQNIIKAYIRNKTDFFFQNDHLRIRCQHLWKRNNSFEQLETRK